MKGLQSTVKSGILLSTPFAVASYFLIWYVPSFDQGKVIWYLIFYCLFQTLQTCFHVPYSSLTMFISSEQKERDSATAYRMTVEVLGSVLGTAIQGQIVGGANVPCIQSALDLGRGVNATVFLPEVNVTKEYVSLDELVLQKKSYMVAAGVIGIVYIVCAFIVFFGVRERPDPTTLRVKKPISFFQGLRLVMGHGPYAKLVMGFLFTSLAFMWVIPFMILIVLIESNLIVTYVVSVAAGISVAAAFLLPWSMLPDVIDDFKICNPQSQGHEAIFYSFYVFFTKFASGVSLGISTLSLDFAGYLTRGCSQPDAVNLTLKMLVSPAPIVLIILGLIIFKLYPINEETRQKNKKILQDMR
ncbi:UNVERIFIED_CONTAM: hypothetical protein FKN15_002001 [Acipenser sinensis]